MNSYIPEFIVDNKVLLTKIEENIKKKQYDELTINVRNLVSLSNKPEDLLDSYYYIDNFRNLSNVAKKIMQVEFKKSVFSDNPNDAIERLDTEHYNYLLMLFHTKLRSDNKRIRKNFIWLIPLTLLLYLFTFVVNFDYYFLFGFLSCIYWIIVEIRLIYLNKKKIKSKKLC